jgi:hypothetical protein
MAEDERAIIAELRREVADLQMRIQRVRQETADQTKNGLEEQIASLVRDSSVNRERYREAQRENAHLWGLLRSRSLAGPEEMVVRPRWPSHPVQLDQGAGFLLMPFGPPWAGQVRTAIGRAFESVGMSCDRADELSGSTVMMDVWMRICECGILIADVTDSNPNVMYELGLADAIGQPTVLISQTAQPNALPFDVLGQRLLVYSVDDLPAFETRLANRLRAARSDSKSAR